MPEHLRALVVLLGLAGAVFFFARPLACAAAMGDTDFTRRRNLWFGLTLAAFLAHSFWIYLVLGGALLLHAAAAERNKLALFYLLLFAVPAIPAEIPGFGLVRYFFAIDHVRLLALTLLVPAFLEVRRQPGVEGFGRLLADKLIGGYLVLLFVLKLPHEPLTEALRTGVFYPFLDVFLPYYVASRSLRSIAQFRDALMAFVVTALVLSAVGLFEFAKRWLLYASLESALGMSWAGGDYLGRGNLLRAQASTGHAIHLGFVIAVALGFFLYLRALAPHPMARRLGLALLVAGLVAPLSRGPWIGAAVMVFAFIATGPAATKRLALAGLLGAAAVPGLLASPAGQTVVDFLPFVGTVETETIGYRQLIVEVSLEVIRQNFYFGAYDAMQLPLMQQLRQGQGIIDLVNTYLGVALFNGVVGLALFCGFFIAALLALARAMARLPDRNDERYRLGHALLATLLGILVIIGTAASIMAIPTIYFSVAGLAVAYARLAAEPAP